MALPLSICTISYNRPKELLEMLQSLIPQLPYDDVVEDVIILNNGSTDDYSEVEKFVLEHPELKIKYIISDENLGVSRGKTKVLKEAKSPYIMVLDDDAEFNLPGDFRKMATIFEKPFFKNNNTAIITIEIFYHSTRERQVNGFPHKNYDQYVNEPMFLTSYFCGGGCLMRKDALENVGYYRHNILYGMEEYDLGYRLINAGYTIGYDNSTRMWHKESPNGRVSTNEKNALMWHNKARIVWIFFPKIYYYTTTFMWGLRYLKLSNFDIKGWFKNINKIRKTIKETPREPINDKGMNFIKSVGTRLWY